METQTNVESRGGAKDFFINLGAIISLAIVVGDLISLLFTVINKAYPVTTGYNYYGTPSISFPVASLIVFFPIYILLMWLLEKEYVLMPEKRNLGVRKWLTYITLFLTGLAFAIDLLYVIYYFIDGQEMTTGFILKALTVLVVTLGVFFYYISDVRGKLNSASRKVWASVSLVIILGAIILGFSVLGSPRTQQLLKYDEQKVNDLVNLNSTVISYFQANKSLPSTMADVSSFNSYYHTSDPQTGQPYEYILIGQSAKAYQLCAVFNKASEADAYKTYPAMYPTSGSWDHPAGHYCFSKSIDLNLYPPMPKLIE